MNVVELMHCFHCNERTNLTYCGGCRVAAYCGKDCQVKGWNATHKYVCRLIGLSVDDVKQEVATRKLNINFEERHLDAIRRGVEEMAKKRYRDADYKYQKLELGAVFDKLTYIDAASTPDQIVEALLSDTSSKRKREEEEESRKEPRLDEEEITKELTFGEIIQNNVRDLTTALVRRMSVFGIVNLLATNKKLAEKVNEYAVWRNLMIRDFGFDTSKMRSYDVWVTRGIFGDVGVSEGEKRVVDEAKAETSALAGNILTSNQVDMYYSAAKYQLREFQNHQAEHRFTVSKFYELFYLFDYGVRVLGQVIAKQQTHYGRADCFTKLGIPMMKKFYNVLLRWNCNCMARLIHAHCVAQTSHLRMEGEFMRWDAQPVLDFTNGSLIHLGTILFDDRPAIKLFTTQEVKHIFTTFLPGWSWPTKMVKPDGFPDSYPLVGGLKMKRGNRSWSFTSKYFTALFLDISLFGGMTVSFRPASVHQTCPLIEMGRLWDRSYCISKFVEWAKMRPLSRIFSMPNVEQDRDNTEIIEYCGDDTYSPFWFQNAFFIEDREDDYMWNWEDIEHDIALHVKGYNLEIPKSYH